MALALTGCHSIGPGTVARDRFEYSGAISESWKRQTLLNIVKLRYLDPPIFVDTSQIVAGYSFETAFNAGGQISSDLAIQGDSATLGGSAKYTDRPTITYTPLTGKRFVKGLMMPLSVESVFFMIESGWPADGVLFATVASINGLKNQQSSIDGFVAADADFLRVLVLMRKMQLSGAVAVRIRQDAQKQQTTVLALRSRDITPQTLEDSLELRRLLKLDPDAQELTLVHGATATNDKEVAVLTRSVLQQMATMAAQVDVPEEDVSQGRTLAGWESISNDPSAIRLIQIRSSTSSPADAFVAVHYRDHWFWIDDSDMKSKRTFSFMMMLFTLADTGEKEPLPLITIPAQ